MISNDFNEQVRRLPDASVICHKPSRNVSAGTHGERILTGGCPLRGDRGYAAMLLPQSLSFVDRYFALASLISVGVVPYCLRKHRLK
jgi:hypothetical protein